jgi:4-oxalocrotonate tautomerase
MPIIHIHILEGRSREKKEALIRNLTETTAATLDAPPENVRVIIHEMRKQDYGIGGVSAEELGR